MPQFVALLDTNVLWPISLCDVLLRAAEADLYHPRWSEYILHELANSLKRERPDLIPARIDRRVADMRDAFPEALVTGYEDLIPVMRNDPKDRPVLAAAVRAGAAVIVTNNVKDFSSEACAPYEVEVQTPDEFLTHLWHLAPKVIAAILQQEAAALRNPPKTPQEIVQTLRTFAPTFATAVLSSALLRES